MHSGVSHTIDSIAPYAPDDSELADLYTRQAYLEQRRQQAVSEFNTLPRCNTPGCQIHATPLNSPTKCNKDEFPELPQKVSSKRKESDDGFISPTSKQTVKRQQLEFKNFELEVYDRFSELKENDTDIAGHSQNSININ
ncbi:hypothetical protein TNIN_394561 [Trichonephila inaurata madagascariensis]|uniref:Uncharacterized protein n=1 Tax=Trichonephila inaurata madagascariensis TaxID=2747483 RepID=A0A8X6MIV9_9ARAC|nr:hypothetical protein TNIN_394561 [Trichonephila inaurata madagascariensis]